MTDRITLPPRCYCPTATSSVTTEALDEYHNTAFQRNLGFVRDPLEPSTLTATDLEAYWGAADALSFRLKLQPPDGDERWAEGTILPGLGDSSCFSGPGQTPFSIEWTYGAVPRVKCPEGVTVTGDIKSLRLQPIGEATFLGTTYDNEPTVFLKRPFGV